MANVRDIRRRIKSVRSTAKITKAMQMVAASKMRKAQDAALQSRPFARLVYRITSQALSHAGSYRHPLMERQPGTACAVVLVTPDKGLCGGLTSNLLREAAVYDPATTVFIAAGKRAAQFIQRTHRKLAAEFSWQDRPVYPAARAISKFVQELYLKGEVQRVDVLFTNFISTLSQKPVAWTLLPMARVAGCETGVHGEMTESYLPQLTDVDLKGATEFEFEPSTAEVLEELLGHNLNFTLYQMLLESRASEQSARMVAMKNATENAEDLIDDLTLQSNQMRQAAITKELLEITSAAMAAEG